MGAEPLMAEERPRLPLGPQNPPVAAGSNGLRSDGVRAAGVRRTSSPTREGTRILGTLPRFCSGPFIIDEKNHQNQLAF